MRLYKYLFAALIACMVSLSSFALADVPAIPFAAMTAVNFDVGWAQPITASAVDSVQADAESYKSYDTETATTSGNHRMCISFIDVDKLNPSAASAFSDALKISQLDGLTAGVIRGSTTL